MSKFFITKYGLAVSLVDNSVLRQLKDVMLDRADNDTIRRLLKDRLISPEQRESNDASNNVLLLNGSLDRIHAAVEESSVRVRPRYEPDEDRESAQTKREEHVQRKTGRWGRTPVGYVGYKKTRQPDLTGPVAAIYETLINSNGDPMTAKELMKRHRTISPQTVRWAIQALRQRGLAETHELESR